MCRALLSIASALQLCAASLCPSTCTATVDGSSFPCRYHGNNCKVSVTPNATRMVVEDINLAVISPYVGGLGDMMTMVEPSIAQALQDVEDSSFLSGFRLNAYLIDSKCSVPDATTAAVAAMTTSPTKHFVFSDSCSAACEAVNDAVRHFNVMQISPGCVSTSLSDSSRYPYFSRMAPSYHFNVLTVYELFKFLGFHRVGVVYGYRSINSLAKDGFLELMARDNADGSYSWTPLYTHRVEVIEDAQAAVEQAYVKDARINFMGLYEVEGSMVLCQCHKRNMLTPEYNWFVASGWWNANFISLTANTAKSPCSAAELQRASYGLIAIDRGPMLNTAELHSLSGRRLSDIYAEYTSLCQGFASGKGACNHQWAGYFYDGIWLIASILHTYLVEQNRSVADLGTEASRQALYDLSLGVDFYGQTGRVRQFNSVGPKTAPPSHGDRDGIVLLRQATGPAEGAFVKLAFRTEAGFDFQTDIKWSPDDTSRMVSCSGACDLANAWVPADRTAQCPAGRIWINEEGCVQCAAGSFAALSASSCQPCAAGSFSNASGVSVCHGCSPGKYQPFAGQTDCEECIEGHYEDQPGSTYCPKCAEGTYAADHGLTQCTACPAGRSSDFEGAASPEMCLCPAGQRLDGAQCLECGVKEVCLGGKVVGSRPSPEEWIAAVELAAILQAQGESMAKYFLLIAKGIEPSANKAFMLGLMDTYNSSLTALLHGDPQLKVPADPGEEAAAAVQQALAQWLAFRALLNESVDTVVQGGFANSAVVQAVARSAEDLYVAVEGISSSLRVAAESAGAYLSGLLVEIAARQRTLIQRICKVALLVAHSVNLGQSRAILQEVSSLYEESREGIVFGIRVAGVPALTEMCTMRQMREVSFYYQQVRPFTREILNAQSNSEASRIASAVVANMSTFVDPLYSAMVEAVKLYVNDTGSCNPFATTTFDEWWALTLGICDTRIGLQSSLRFFMQIANGLAVQESKVELTVVVSAQTQLLRDLVTGNKLDNMPSPVTQEMLNQLIEARAGWSALMEGLEEAIQLDELPQVDVFRGIILGNAQFSRLMNAMELLVQAVGTAGSLVETRILDLTHRQQHRLHQIPVKAYQILLGYEVDTSWQELNASIADYRLAQRQMVLGAPASGNIKELVPVTNICVVRMFAAAFSVYHRIEEACYDLARGNRARVNDINVFVPAALAEMELASHALEHFYDGRQEAVCENLTLSVDEWSKLMAATMSLGGLSQDVITAFTLASEVQGPSEQQGVTAALEELTAAMERLVMGYPSSHVPTQPTQKLFNQVLQVLLPAKEALHDAVSQLTVSQAMARANALLETTKTLAATYRAEGQRSDGLWQGLRVEKLMWQSVLAKKLLKEATLTRYSVTVSTSATVLEFETALAHLKDGGGGIEPIIPERKELLDQWELVNGAWTRFKSASEKMDASMDPALEELLIQLEAAIPLFAVQDIKSETTVPWVFYVAYCVLGLVLLSCSCVACYLARTALRKKAAHGGPAV
ncbi:unnamed protein product [Effrenium voratum]|uniref:Uncharacterized protein n=1 Tax=Effrenium voratum TaxID=2562239 RepID=A0AA36JID2_9DINO|nr:unnamed protein product [Effrenium voratum]